MAIIKGLGALGNFYGIKPQEKPPQQKTQPPKISSNTATVPYNFVPLPEKILPAPLDNLNHFAEYLSGSETFSGEISLELEALTPLFIGGNGTKTFAPQKNCKL